MTRGFVICAMACGVAAPAAAGERNAAALALKIPVPRSVLSTPKPAPAFGAALPKRLPAAPLSSFAVKLRDVPASNPTLSALDARPGGPIAAPATIDDVTLTNFSLDDIRTVAAWRASQRLRATTASANGSYAVRDTLAGSRKPRAFRSTPFSTTLMLRLDGRDESPSFGIGGGGVAAALWRAMPQ